MAPMRSRLRGTSTIVKRRVHYIPKAHRRFIVRRATPHDLDVLVRQRRGMWESMGVRDKPELNEADRVYRQWARKEFRNRSLLGWVAESNGIIIGGGCLWLQPVQPRPGWNKGIQPYLLSMYTEPSFRAMGVASRIVEEAAKWAKKNGYPQLTLDASSRGRRVYSKFGFKRTWEMRLKFSRKSSRALRASPAMR